MMDSTSTFRLGRTKCPVLRQSVMLATFSKRSVMVDLEVISPSRKVGFENVKFQDQNPREMHDLSQTSTRWFSLLDFDSVHCINFLQAHKVQWIQRGCNWFRVLNGHTGVIYGV